MGDFSRRFHYFGGRRLHILPRLLEHFYLGLVHLPLLVLVLPWMRNSVVRCGCPDPDEEPCSNEGPRDVDRRWWPWRSDSDTLCHDHRMRAHSRIPHERTVLVI